MKRTTDLKRENLTFTEYLETFYPDFHLLISLVDVDKNEKVKERFEELHDEWDDDYNG